MEVCSNESLLPLCTAIIAGTFTLSGVIVGAFVNAKFSLGSQKKMHSYKERQQAYASILGNRILLMQLLVSRFEAYIFSDYHEKLWHLANCPEKSIDLDEAQRWMRKSEDLVVDITKTKQTLYESIGKAMAVFPKSEAMTSLCKKVYNFGTPVVPKPPNTTSKNDLTSWKDQTVKHLQSLVDSEYGKPLDDLLSILVESLNG